jgi:hypothetical protein
VVPVVIAFLSKLLGFTSVIEKGLDYFIKKADGDVIKAVEMMKVEQAWLAATRDVQIAAMNTVTYWVGWALFVFPLGLYWAKILIVDKILGWGKTDPLTGLVADWAGIIVLGLFGIAAAPTILRSLRK